MKNLDSAATAAETELASRDEVREFALKRTRDIIRLSGGVIRQVHRGEDPAAALEEVSREAAALREGLAAYPEFFHAGAVENALMEVAEAHLVVAAHRGDPLPTHDEIGVTAAAWVLGLGDLVGELRRMALDALATGETALAMRRLDEMEEAYGALMRFDFPSAIVEARRKQDVARGLVERTRGEVAVATRQQKLETQMTELKDMLDEIEGKPRETAEKGKKPRTIDLDVDSVY